MSNPRQTPSGARPPDGYPVPPDHPRATTILVLGGLGLGPFAWVMGRRALKEIDSSGGSIGGRRKVWMGYVCGIIATALLVLTVVLAVIGVILG